MNALKNKIDRVLYGAFTKGQILQADLGESIALCKVRSYLGNGKYSVCLAHESTFVFEVNEDALYPTTKIFSAKDKETSEEKMKRQLDEMPTSTRNELEALTKDIKETLSLQEYVNRLASKIKSDLQSAHITEEMEARLKAEQEKVEKILQENALTKQVLEGVEYSVSRITPMVIAESKVDVVEDIVHRLSALVAKTVRPEFDKIAAELIKTIDTNVSFKAKLESEVAKQIKKRVEEEQPTVVKKEVVPVTNAKLIITASIKDVVDSWISHIKNLGVKILAKFIPKLEKSRKEIEELNTKLQEATSE
jgi:hypothetical protein